MQKVHKPVMLVFLMLFIIIVTGCSKTEEKNNNLIVSSISAEDIAEIVVEYGDYYQILTDMENTQAIIHLIQDIKVEDYEIVQKGSIGYDDIIRVRIIDNNGVVSLSLSMTKKAAFYNGEWHTIDEASYERILTYINKNKSEEVLNDDKLRIQIIQENRSNMGIIDALVGVWMRRDGSKLKFTENILYQGNNFEYEFEYRISDISEDTIQLSVYGMEGILLKDKKLSNMTLRFDPTKSHMITNKNMVGGMTYKDKLILVDEEFQIGNFDDLFFLED